MQFVIHWTFDPHDRDNLNARFLEGGAPPPAGVTMLGRWHSVGGGEGFLACESDNSEAVARWMQEWSDRLRFRVLPVMDDEMAGRILSG